MSENNKNPVAPYMAIGLSTVLYGIAERKYIKINLETIEENNPFRRCEEHPLHIHHLL